MHGTYEVEQDNTAPIGMGCSYIGPMGGQWSHLLSKSQGGEPMNPPTSIPCCLDLDPWRQWHNCITLMQQPREILYSLADTDKKKMLAHRLVVTYSATGAQHLLLPRIQSEQQ